jgi:hypothetical protein
LVDESVNFVLAGLLAIDYYKILLCVGLSIGSHFKDAISLIK